MEILTEESINPAFKRVNYRVRGWLESRSYEIQQELKHVRKVIPCYIYIYIYIDMYKYSITSDNHGLEKFGWIFGI